MSAPGDRRRFGGYAALRGFDFEVARPGSDYDLVVVSTGGDIVTWAGAKRRGTKLVYDLIGSYLAAPPDIKDRLRGIGKYALRDLGRPVPSYRRAVERLCARADAVVCVTQEQKQMIERLCPNVHVILDIHDYAVHEVKTTYTRGETFNLFWEGLPYTLSDFAQLTDTLERFASEVPVALHVMTDLRFGRYSRRLLRTHTRNLADKLFSRTYLYEWNELLLSRLASGCDLGVIPLSLSDPFISGKPENKLLLLWRMGLPTLTSATPAYQRAMDQAGIDMTCSTADEWLKKLHLYAEDEHARRRAGELGHNYAEHAMSRDRMLERWDAVLGSIGVAMPAAIPASQS